MKIPSQIFTFIVLMVLLLLGAIMYQVADLLWYCGAFSLVAFGLCILYWLVLSGFIGTKIGIEKFKTTQSNRVEAQYKSKEAEYKALKAQLDALSDIVVASEKSQTYHRRLQDGQVIIEPLHLTGPDDRWYPFYTRHNSDITIEQPDPIALPAPQLPDLIKLDSVLPGLVGNMENLVLGMQATPQGLEPVSISAYNLFHLAASASTGFGKSAFVSAILLQLATCRQPTEFILIDQQEHGLAGFKGCDRLRYPILREPGEILSALREVHAEALGKRSELFNQYDADDLGEYNRIAPDPLPAIFVVADEASALLSGDREIASELKRQAWELRKFGVFQFLMLTSAKGTTIDTDHRQQFASIAQLHANDRYQANLLTQAGDAMTFPPGRAVIQLPGRSPVTVQTPYVDKRTIRNILRTGKVPDMPIAQDGPSLTEKERLWIDLVNGGMSKNQASIKVFERTYSGNITRLSSYLDSSTPE